MVTYIFYYHLRSTVKRERFFAYVYFSNVTVSQTTVSTGPMKMLRLDRETKNVCQRNVARFAHVECRFDKIRGIFRVLEVRCDCDRMEALKVNKFGWTYRTGIALDQDMRSLIIDRILHEGGDRVTGYIPRSFRYFSEELKLSVNRATMFTGWRHHSHGQVGKF